MEIIGRITADATTTELKDGRKVVNFGLAHNERYKPKGSTEYKQITTFFNCAYWMAAGVAAFLRKGALVQLTGRVGVNAWTAVNGQARARLTFFVKELQFKGRPATGDSDRKASDLQAASASTDDLPF